MTPIQVKRFQRGDDRALSHWSGLPVEEIRRDVEEHHAEGRDRWLAWDGNAVVGAVSRWRSPDGRLRLYFDRCRDDAWEPLLATIRGPAVTSVNGLDDGKRAALERLGFRVARTEWLYEIPTATYAIAVPPGFQTASAQDVPVQEVMALDGLLRDDIPGSEGWEAALEWFRAEKHDSPYFDPECYLIARSGQENVGLVRVWNGPRPRPRLGMVGVLEPHRGQGLATALLAQVLSIWAKRGSQAVTAEVDAENAASNRLMSRFQGRIVGSETEMIRRH